MSLNIFERFQAITSIIVLIVQQIQLAHAGASFLFRLGAFILTAGFIYFFTRWYNEKVGL